MSETINQSAVSPEQLRDIERRKKLGKAGKLWTIEVLGRVGNEVMKRKLLNQDNDEILHFREEVFKIGLMLCRDPGHWVIIPPTELLEIHLFRQKFYSDAQF